MSPATKEHPTVRVLRTRSGSTYHVVGTQVRRTSVDGPDEVYTLVSLGERSLRYTDGTTIFVSSEVVDRS